MKAIQIVLLGAILAALLSIAIELHTISGKLTPVAALSGGTMKAFTPVAETRAQRDARLRRETQELMLDAAAIGSAWTVPKQPPTRK